MNYTGQYMKGGRRTLIVTILLASLFSFFLSTVVVAQDKEKVPNLTSEKIVNELNTVKSKVKEIGELYPKAVSKQGDEILNQEYLDKSLQLAKEARAAFGQEQTTDLFDAIKARSPAVADPLKARVAQLVTAVTERKPVPEVRNLIEPLVPDLNRAVIIARSKVFPEGERQLKTEQAIRQATRKVTDLVNQAIAKFEDGKIEEAAGFANDAFFELESNGLGPDSTLVDEQLENEVESNISAFGPGTSEDPGLEQLIRQEASMDRILKQQELVRNGLMKIQELLVETLPESRLGDVNGDGQLTITDALFIAQTSLGLRNIEKASADTNCDGKVTITDALFVAQASLDLRDLPEECST